MSKPVSIPITAAQRSLLSAAARKRVNLLMKPLNGGIPPIANAPTKKQNPVTGILLATNLSSLIFRLPAEYIKAPAHRKRSALIMV